MENSLKIKVGSKNKAKVEAVAEVILEYPHLKEMRVEGADVSSGVGNQPKSLEETIQGGMNRAKNAFHDCVYSIGLESGFMKVPYTKSGYLEACFCIIFDGKEFHIGMSSAWEFPDPKIITDFIFKEGLDLSQAIIKAGYTKNSNIGAENGAIGILTKNRVDRKEYTKQALRMALIHIDQHSF